MKTEKLLIVVYKEILLDHLEACGKLYKRTVGPLSLT